MARKPKGVAIYCEKKKKNPDFLLPVRLCWLIHVVLLIAYKKDYDNPSCLTRWTFHIIYTYFCQYWFWNTDLGGGGWSWVRYEIQLYGTTCFLLALQPEPQNVQWALSKFTPEWISDVQFKYLATLQRLDKGNALLARLFSPSAPFWMSVCTLVPSSITWVWGLRFSRDVYGENGLQGPDAV